MYKVDLPVDDSKDKVVEARRSAERARKARFFNPRLRVMGVDLDALNQQVLENKHKRSCEKLRNRDFGNYKHSPMSFASVRHAEGWLWLQCSSFPPSVCRIDIGVLERATAVNPIKVGSHLVLSLFLFDFQGEDRGRKERVKEQMRKKVKDLQEQMDDKKMRDTRAKHRGEKSLILYCSTQAEVRALDRREQRRNEAADNLVEIWHTGTSDMLTETAEPAETYLGGGRPPHVLPDKWRGMSLAQLNNFHEQREQQRLEKKVLLLSRLHAFSVRFCTLYVHFCFCSSQHYLNKELYTDKPTRDYFAQFNTGCR
uniref:RIB43A-like with coiled-coils protein 1 n=1 Tax=Poecilia mexicana TaxID=48701 RepID=A0A3B3WZ81_9TELE